MRSACLHVRRPAGSTVPAELLRQARRQPGALAIVAGEHRADYATLAASSGAIAGALQASGVHPGDRVAVFIDRSLHMIAALVGTHLAGAAYVPLDPGYPETRNRSLESINALFSTPSPFYWKMEQAYKLHGDVLAEHGVDKDQSLSEIKAVPSAEETNF